MTAHLDERKRAALRGHGGWRRLEARPFLMTATSEMAEGEKAVWWRMVAVLVGGLGFGAAATWLNVPPEPHVLDGSARRVASLVVNAGAVWAGVAVLGGRVLATARLGLLAGPVALVPAVVAYYSLGAVFGSENPGGSLDLILVFGVVALLTGPVLGVLGGLSRRRDALGLAGALVLPAGVIVELVWRSSVPGLPPDPARPAADMILVGLALAGATAAVARRLRAATATQATGGVDDAAPG